MATPPSSDEFFRVRVCFLLATGSFGSAGGDNEGAEDADDAADEAADMRSDVGVDTADGLYSRPSAVCWFGKSHTDMFKEPSFPEIVLLVGGFGASSSGYLIKFSVKSHSDGCQGRPGKNTSAGSGPEEPWHRPVKVPSRSGGGNGSDRLSAWAKSGPHAMNGDASAMLAMVPLQKIYQTC